MGKEYHKRGWIIFSSKTEIWWLRFLKKGYRHCFLIIEMNDCLVSIDPLSTYIEISTFPLEEKNTILLHLCKREHIILPVVVTTPKAMPVRTLSLFSCVGLIKKILGIHDRTLWTPWQLAKHIIQLK